MLSRCIISGMDKELFRKVRSELARQGGLERAKAMTEDQERKSATKASKGRSEGDDYESQDQETKSKSMSGSARLRARQLSVPGTGPRQRAHL
jgi:hypothetical protein